MQILVTGVCGFIGSNFVYHLLGSDKDCQIVGVDKLTYAGNYENLVALPKASQARFRFVKGDINDGEHIEQLFEEYDFSAVINFAAESHVDRSIHDSQVFLVTNVLGTQTLLDVAKKHWKADVGYRSDCRFVQISTDEVYGALGSQGKFCENTPLSPRNPYSASKTAADHICMAYYHTYGFPVSITRCSNNYGPYQFPEKLIPLIIRNALKHERLPVYGDGLQVRDWLYVEDHCRAVNLVWQQAAPGEVYNIGGNNERENLGLVRVILDILHQRTNDAKINHDLIQHVEDRLGHDRRYAIDASKIEHELGWTPRVSFEEGIRSTIDWYLQHQSWTDHVISGEYRDFYAKNYETRLAR